MKELSIISTVFVTVICLTTISSSVEANPSLNKPVIAPVQPLSGPGGSDYSYNEVVSNRYGEGDDEYWIFEPSSPKADSAPLIVFNHGWTAVNPNIYGAWIKHIVKKGNIVVYPRYQANLRTPTDKFTPNAIKAVRDAIAELQNGDHVKPELDKFAIVGHSAGGLITANMAASASSNNLPVPRAVMCVEPGNSWIRAKRIAIPLENLTTIPPQTLLLSLIGDRDNVVRDIDAKKIFQQSTQIPPENKNLVTVISDEYGQPPLIANHIAPAAIDTSLIKNASGLLFGKNEQAGAGLRVKIKQKAQSLFQRLRSLINDFNPFFQGSFGGIRSLLKERVSRRSNQPEPEESLLSDTTALANAFAGGKTESLDYYGWWKLFDALTDCAFYEKNCNYALGGSPEQKFMGIWSDGTPVKELQVSISK